MKTILSAMALASLCFVLYGCGPKGLYVNWDDHRTIRTCAGVMTGHTGPGEPICSGYARKADVVGAVTDAHYVTVQIERVYFRDLPEWLGDAEVAIEVRMKGLLPDNQEYREVLDIVHVKKHSFLQVQNKSLNFPVRYRNRTVSIGFTITELNDAEQARYWFNKGRDVLKSVGVSNWLTGVFGTGLVYEIATEVADKVFVYANQDTHIFSLKQVDFLPALSVTGLQEQLMLTEGRYVVVGVPPATAYDSLRDVIGHYPERIDATYLQNNTFFEGGYLKMKDTGSEYTYSPYVVLNVVMGQRYFDENTIIEGIKEANRLIQFGQLDQAEALLNATQANLLVPSAVSPKDIMKEAGVVSDDPDKGLLDVEPSELVRGAEAVVRGQDPGQVLHGRLQKMGLVGGVVGALVGTRVGSPDIKEVPRKETSEIPLPKDRVPVPEEPPTQAEAPSVPPASAGDLGMRHERLYTDQEYTYFADLFNAMGAKLSILRQGSPPRAEVERVLRLFRRAVDNSKDLPRSPAECQVIQLSMRDLWENLLSSYGLEPDDEVTDGNRMSLVRQMERKGKLGDLSAEEAFDDIFRQKRLMDNTHQACLPKSLKAY